MCRSKTSLLTIITRGAGGGVYKSDEDAGGGGYIKVTKMLVRKLKFTWWLFVPLMEPRTNKGGLKLKTDP